MITAFGIRNPATRTVRPDLRPLTYSFGIPTLLFQVVGPSFGRHLSQVVLGQSGSTEPAFDLGHESAVVAEIDLARSRVFMNLDMICLTGLRFSVISPGA